MSSGGRTETVVTRGPACVERMRVGVGGGGYPVLVRGDGDPVRFCFGDARGSGAGVAGGGGGVVAARVFRRWTLDCDCHLRGYGG
jgi:hypothetical protein